MPLELCKHCLASVAIVFVDSLSFVGLTIQPCLLISLGFSIYIHLPMQLPTLIEEAKAERVAQDAARAALLRRARGENLSGNNESDSFTMQVHFLKSDRDSS